MKCVCGSVDAFLLTDDGNVCVECGNRIENTMQHSTNNNLNEDEDINPNYALLLTYTDSLLQVHLTYIDKFEE